MDWSRIKAAARSPKSYASQWKADQRGHVIGYFCSYVPEEIITAAGALPFRITPDSNRTISKADSHLQAYCCGMVRGALEEALTGELKFISGTVFPHTCDSIQRLSDIWRMNIDGAFHTDLLIPAKLNSQSSRDYLIKILLKFKQQIETLTGLEITAERLTAAARTHNTIRHQLARLYELRRRSPEVISSKDIFALLKAAMVMDRFEMAELLEELMFDLVKKDAPEDLSAKRIVLSGGVCNLPDLYSIISSNGAHVVWDDFCTGSRYFEGILAQDKDFFEAIADRYIQRSICPTKHTGITGRGDHLKRIVKRTSAHGVIFLRLKFCDPHAFDYPYMQETLAAMNIPSIQIDIDPQQAFSEQIRTRCEAFIEML